MNRIGLQSIVLVCSNLTSFVQFYKDINAFVRPQTCFISVTFGLQRNRIYNIMHAPSVFRTYVEITTPTPTLATIAANAATSASPDSSNSDDETVDDSKGRSGAAFTQPVSDAKKKAMRLSARLVASRLNGVRNFIMILENFYILLGMQPMFARKLAGNAVLGESCFPEFDGSSLLGSVGATAASDLGSLQTEHTNPIAVMLFRMHAQIGRYFQHELSRHIRIVDLPAVKAMVLPLSSSNLHLSSPLPSITSIGSSSKSKLTNQRRGSNTSSAVGAAAVAASLLTNKAAVVHPMQEYLLSADELTSIFECDWKVAVDLIGEHDSSLMDKMMMEDETSEYNDSLFDETDLDGEELRSDITDNFNGDNGDNGV